MLRRWIAAVALAAAVLAPAHAASTYTVDPSHSEVSFQIRHLVTQVRGVFRDFDATIVRDDEKPGGSSVELRIRATSIDTGNERRDNHLRTADFFDVENHPEIVFRSTAVEQVSEHEYEVTGELTLRGVTKSVELPVFFSGEIGGPRDATIAGFSTSATLDRKEYGIVWNRALDSGGYVLGDEVSVQVNLETRKQ